MCALVGATGLRAGGLILRRSLNRGAQKKKNPGALVRATGLRAGGLALRPRQPHSKRHRKRMRRKKANGMWLARVGASNLLGLVRFGGPIHRVAAPGAPGD